MRLIAPLLALVLAAGPAGANDSTAELGAGGLLLTRSDAIRLVAEDLFISMEEVRVDYVFANRRDEAVESIVAFPMPDLPGGIDSNVSIPDSTRDNFLDFSTTIDGESVVATLDQRAVVAGVDVTDTIVAHKVPLLPSGDATADAIRALSPDVLEDWLARGLVGKQEFNAGKGWQTAWHAKWTLRSAYWWRAVFPAGSEMRVSHRYRPSVGISASAWLIHDGEPNEYFPDYRSRYCIDDAFLAALIRADARGQSLGEYRLDYVLTSGGNWANGTIGRFRLVIDKGRPDNLVSFCGENVVKTGPTTFEMIAENHYPARDIKVLILSPR
ncbi:MAG: DUF4424 domain-containing protein [Pseudomonadota bacterium]|nr:DUF4424 domain-containing protein [Pseudomonadota bacterium]